MTHYDVSSRLRTIAQAWQYLGGQDESDSDRPDEYILDGSGDEARRLYETAGALVDALLGVILPRDVWEGPRVAIGGDYEHPVLGLMASLTNEHGDDLYVFPIAEFCRRYGLTWQTVELGDDEGEDAEALQGLLLRGTCPTKINELWRPKRPGSAAQRDMLRPEAAEATPDDWWLLLKQCNEEWPYVVWARPARSEDEAEAIRQGAEGVEAGDLAEAQP